MSGVLTQARYKIALAEICEIDSDLAEVVNAYGPPPIWRRPAGFRTLLYLILEQQVSLASARATYEKLVARLGAEPDPHSFLALGDDDSIEPNFGPDRQMAVNQEDALSAGSGF